MEKFTYARRLTKIPPYMFAQLAELRRKTKDVIDFSEGNPDMPPPKPVIRAMVKALNNPSNHRYPSYEGNLELREAVAQWYKERFNVNLDPVNEVSIVLGTKEGIAHLIWGLVDKGDKVYVPDPCFPMYLHQTILVGATPIRIPLVKENRFLPDLSNGKNLSKIKVLLLNYPNNPTGAVAPKSFYEEVVKKAEKYGFYVMQDNVYSEIYFNKPPNSILEIPQAKEHCVEFHSFSKTFNMPGWRLGFIVGSQKLISAMRRIKENVDSGPFKAIQEAALIALRQGKGFAEKNRLCYKERRDLFCEGLVPLKRGWEFLRPEATFYVWVKVNSDSLSFAQKLLTEAKILVAPGIGFGKYGAGYVRFALIQPKKIIRQALNRLHASRIWLR